MAINTTALVTYKDIWFTLESGPDLGKQVDQIMDQNTEIYRL